MSDALQTFSDLAADGKESRSALAVLRDHEARLTALETATQDATAPASTDTPEES